MILMKIIWMVAVICKYLRLQPNYVIYFDPSFSYMLPKKSNAFEKDINIGL